MARGWESKSVEEQMAQAMYSSNGVNNAETLRVADAARADRQRKLQALQLQRENILSQRTSNPSRRAALEAALEQIEASIAQLG